MRARSVHKVVDLIVKHGKEFLRTNENKFQVSFYCS